MTPQPQIPWLFCPLHQLLGTGVTALALLGLAASGRECLSLRTLMLVGLGFSALSTLELMQQVGLGAHQRGGVRRQEGRGDEGEGGYITGKLTGHKKIQAQRYFNGAKAHERAGCSPG